MSSEQTPQTTTVGFIGLGHMGGLWGIHDLDIAQWLNEADHTTPISAEGTFDLSPENSPDQNSSTNAANSANGKIARLSHRGARGSASGLAQTRIYPILRRYPDHHDVSRARNCRAS